MVVIGFSAFVVPEVRQFLHLEKRPEARAIEAPSFSAPSKTTYTATTEPPGRQPTTSEKIPVTQKARSHTKGKDNITGSNASGDRNVVGDNHQTGVAIAPNGIAISGGNVTNPTVNNFAPPPQEPAVVTICVGDSGNVKGDMAHDGEFRLVLTLTTNSPVENPTLGLQFSGPILTGGSSASSPDMAVNIKEGVTTPMSYAFVLYQTWYPGQRVNVEIHSHESISLVNAVGKHSESFTVTHGGCRSGL
jgi:hypothetical protein